MPASTSSKLALAIVIACVVVGCGRRAPDRTEIEVVPLPARETAPVETPWTGPPRTLPEVAAAHACIVSIGETGEQPETTPVVRIDLNGEIPEPELREICGQIRAIISAGRPLVVQLNTPMCQGKVGSFWANASYDDDPERISINGLTVEEKAALLAMPAEPLKYVVGAWICPVATKCRITIGTNAADQFVSITRRLDDSIQIAPVLRLGKFFEVIGSEMGEALRVREDGDLEYVIGEETMGIYTRVPTPRGRSKTPMTEAQ